MRRASDLIRTLLAGALATVAAFGEAAPAATAAAADVTTLTGRAMAATPEGAIRTLEPGKPVYSGETIVTNPNSYIRMKFTDGGAVLLRPNSRFQIEDYNLSDRPAENRSFFRLVKGGFRAVTGLVGRTNRENYRVTTAVATIGIRGTDFEGRLCEGDCLDVDPPVADGLYVGVKHNDVIELCTAAGCIDVDAGQFAFAPAPNVKPEHIPQPSVLPGDMGSPDCP
jgi:hypothetical protein